VCVYFCHSLSHTHTYLIAFLDGYCSTLQGLLDWFEVDLGFPVLVLFRLICVFCVCLFLSHSLSRTHTYLITQTILNHLIFPTGKYQVGNIRSLLQKRSINIGSLLQKSPMFFVALPTGKYQVHNTLSLPPFLLKL